MTGVDSVVLNFLNGVAGKYFLLDGIYIFFSEYLIYILGTTFFLYLFKVKDWKERMQILSLGVIAVIISRGIVTPLIRFFFYKPRPFMALDVNTLIDHADTGSFPSGHIAFLVPLMLILWHINKRAGVWGLVGAFLMGVARIGVGAHWPTDILGGFLVGTIGYAIPWFLLKNKIFIKKENVQAGTSL